jgi:hypothetical protein
MSRECLEAVRSTVLEQVRLGQVIDVYALASKFHRQFPEFTVEELVRIVSDLVATLPGTAAIWERTDSEATASTAVAKT